MQPEIDLLGLPIKTFGLMFALGFIAAGAVIARRLKDLGKPTDWAYEIAFSGMLGGLVGARLWYVVTHTGELSDDPFGTLFGGSGLVWWGGALGGAAAILLWGRRKGWKPLELTDVCVVPLAFGNAIGRVGCQLSGDGDYGKAWSGPWAMAYPDGTVPTTETVHPTPIYETLVMGAGALVLWHLRDRFRPGVLSAMYFLLAGTERLLVEFLRRNDPDIIGLTAAQVFSIGLMALGAAMLVWFRGRPGGWAAAPPAASPGETGRVAVAR